MKAKIQVFKEYFDDELGKHKTRQSAFNAAREKFETTVKIKSYSSYDSFLNCLRKSK